MKTVCKHLVAVSILSKILRPWYKQNYLWVHAHKVQNVLKRRLCEKNKMDYIPQNHLSKLMPILNIVNKMLISCHPRLQLLCNTMLIRLILLTQTISRVSVLSIFPKAADPVMLWQAWMVASWVAHLSPNRATYLLHSSRLWPVQSRGLDRSVSGYRATEKRSIMTSTSVGRTELLLLLLTLLGHPWVLRVANPIRKPSDRKLLGEGSSTDWIWRKSWSRWCKVVVKGSLGSWGIFSMEQGIGKSN